MKNGEGGIIGSAAGLLVGWALFPMVATLVLALGGYGGYQYLQRAEQAAHARQVAQAEPRPHCKTVNALVIKEFDALIAEGKFPTEAKQEEWKRLSATCGEGQ